MAETSVEINFPAFLDGCQKVGFAYHSSPRLARGCRRGGVWRCDYANAEGCLDGVWKAETRADDRAIFEGAQTNMQFVFAACGGTADFSGANVSIS